MSESTKILVISDVHGRLRDLRWVLQNETADAMFYLGDGLYDLNAALELRREPVPYPIYRVAGNCDVNYSEPSEGLGSLRDGGSYGVITIENGKCSFTWKRVPEF